MPVPLSQFPGSDRHLDPQIRAILAARYNPSAPRLTSLTPQDIRAATPPGLPAVVAPIGSIRDLEMPGGGNEGTMLAGALSGAQAAAESADSPIALRLYRPEVERNDRGIVYFHGGGFVFGSIDTHENIARLLSTACERPVVSVGYRLAPEHPFPAAVEDAFAAVNWIDAHAAELGIGRGALGLAGDSSGAALAADCAYLAAEGSDAEIEFQVLMTPALSLDMSTPGALASEDCPGGTRAEMQWWIDHYLAEPGDALNPLASPVLMEDMGRMPPTLIIAPEHDPLNDGSRLFRQRLEAAGVAVDLREYPGTVHSFIGYWQSADVARRAFADVGEFAAQFG